MAGKSFDLIKIAVTGGDAIESNRLHGKSNTGTYFVCSLKDFETYKRFFENQQYFLDINKVEVYKYAFKGLFSKYKELYKDHMKYFDDFCDSLKSYIENPEIFINLRQNDVRVFMKFTDNNREVENTIRQILYSELSSIVIERHGNKCLVYPEVNVDAKLKTESLY